MSPCQPPLSLLQMALLPDQAEACHSKELSAELPYATSLVPQHHSVPSQPCMKLYQSKCNTGTKLASWGSNLFYMPHMISIDHQGYVWVTDVGLHQIFKFDASGILQMTLGERLSPGQGSSFCKPTHVGLHTPRRTIFVA